MLAEIQTNVAELFGPRARTPAYGCTSRLLPSSKKEPLCSGWRDPSFHEEAGLIYPACRLRGTAASAQKEAPAADGPTLMLCQRLRARASTHTSLPVRTTAGSAKSRIETRRGFRIRGKRRCPRFSVTAGTSIVSEDDRWLSSTFGGGRLRPVSSPAMPAGDRVYERRRAAALARHYRDAEGLSIREISRRLARAEATVKAYLYDPSQANKRPRCS